ncbi:MAG: hypothetical protein SF052_07260 [Bacteroidia bacterium]|nr:hypothetical protein [Bacteroidia bacterium]
MIENRASWVNRVLFVALATAKQRIIPGDKRRPSAYRKYEKIKGGIGFLQTCDPSGIAPMAHRIRRGGIHSPIRDTLDIYSAGIHPRGRRVAPPAYRKYEKM